MIEVINLEDVPEKFRADYVEVEKTAIKSISIKILLRSSVR